MNDTSLMMFVFSSISTKIVRPIGLGVQELCVIKLVGLNSCESYVCTIQVIKFHCFQNHSNIRTHSSSSFLLVWFGDVLLLSLNVLRLFGCDFFVLNIFTTASYIFFQGKISNETIDA